MLSFFTLFALVWLGEALTTVKKSKVINGYDGDITATPWFVSVTFNGGYDCSGALISEEWVITSASCIFGRDTSSFEIVAGQESFTDDPGLYQIIGVDTIYEHADYVAGTGENDIALVHLSSPAEINQRVKAILLPSTGNSWANDLCVTCGWGSIEHVISERLQPETFQCTQADVISHGQCQQFLSAISNFELQDSMLCHFDPGTGPCYGDVGAPLACISEDSGTNVEELAGIFSWFFTINVLIDGDYYQACSVYDPAIYTRVSEFTDWIQDITGPL